ncbi:hypothetical protein FBUS_04666 [Fasciolopsis buskii]|uniref:Uncharacterized protein n=1 Tax=Fasciolopsis buskii TaxID=27845 RepID=A0A8E0RV84_9TREM|nr:hypothetical protein FBUS_04666 [Fasciolopsis buski]
MTAAKDTYSNLQKENRNMIKIPEYNYRQGERKTMLYNGSGWYIPCERRWESYDQHHELPRLARPDAIEFESEKQFVNFLKRRDVPKWKKITAHIPSGPPYPKWNGHHRIPNNEFENPCQYNVEKRPVWDGPGYYGYYQEILDRMQKGQCRRLARQGNIGYPYFTHQTYF